jgi:hypothetical protein
MRRTIGGQIVHIGLLFRLARFTNTNNLPFHADPMHAVVFILVVVGAVIELFILIFVPPFIFVFHRRSGVFFLRQDSLQSGDEARTVGVRQFTASAFSVNVSPHLTHVRAEQDFPEKEETPTKYLNRNSKRYNFLYK